MWWLSQRSENFIARERKYEEILAGVESNMRGERIQKVRTED